MHSQLLETSRCYRFISETALLQGLLTLVIIAASSASAAMSDSAVDLILSVAVAVLREMTSWLRIRNGHTVTTSELIDLHHDAAATKSATIYQLGKCKKQIFNTATPCVPA